jgi:phosphoribosylglycinamide formyltransferase-1
MKHIAIFASGAGTNAKNIIGYFSSHPKAKVVLVACNKPGAGVLDIAAEARIPTLMIEKERFFRGDAYVNELKEKHIDLIVLAGFLWKVPPQLIAAFPGRIVNIHPALLPKYGGKGMYGAKVHEAVIAASEKESGISIHLVDEIYDNGEIVFSISCPVSAGESPESLAQKIHALEYEYYPKVIENLLDRF